MNKDILDAVVQMKKGDFSGILFSLFQKLISPEYLDPEYSPLHYSVI